MNMSLQSIPYRAEMQRNLLRAQDTSAYQSLYMAASMCAFIYDLNLREHKSRSVNLAKDLVLKLTRELGLSVSVAARILDVTRPTIYSWIKTEREPQAAQIERVNQVREAVLFIKKYDLTGVTLNWEATIGSGSSIVSLLCEKDIDLTAITDLLNILRNSAVVYVADISDEELEARPVASQRIRELLKTASTWSNE